MKRNELAELSAFATIAEERSFTRAAIRLGISPSALSHSMRGLEKSFRVAVLNRPMSLNRMSEVRSGVFLDSE